MKLLALVSCALLPGASGSRVVADSAQSKVLVATHTAVAAPEDVAMCAKTAKDWFNGRLTASAIAEKGVDHCSLQKVVDDRNYVCPHFREALENVFDGAAPSQEYSLMQFCTLAENYMLGIRGASRLPNIGSGPLVNFQLSPQCAHTVKVSMLPKASLPSADVPDFWFAMCMNQDCAHFLPSRTRWCNVEKAPTHTAQVCEAVRKFAEDEVQVRGDDDMDPSAVCEVYAQFVQEIGMDVEAYEHVMHADDSRHMPVPGDDARALRSSRLVNEAGSHYLRDNAGSPVEPMEAVKGGAATAVPAAVIAVAVGIAAAFA